MYVIRIPKLFRLYFKWRYLWTAFSPATPSYARIICQFHAFFQASGTKNA